MTNLAEIARIVNEFQSAAYDTGWYAGAIEQGRKDLVEAQKDAIYARMMTKKKLLDAIEKIIGEMK